MSFIAGNDRVRSILARLRDLYPRAPEQLRAACAAVAAGADDPLPLDWEPEADMGVARND